MHGCRAIFISTVQQRGAAIIKARGASSAGSAANAIVDSVRSITMPTREGDWYSVAVCSRGEYDVEPGPDFLLPGAYRFGRLVRDCEVGAD
jgi:malate dehydrogenase